MGHQYLSQSLENWFGVEIFRQRFHLDPLVEKQKGKSLKALLDIHPFDGLLDELNADDIDNE